MSKTYKITLEKQNKPIILTLSELDYDLLPDSLKEAYEEMGVVEIEDKPKLLKQYLGIII
jgi:hypothetical protein